MENSSEAIKMHQKLVKMKGDMEAYLKHKSRSDYSLRMELEHGVSVTGRIIELLHQKIPEDVKH